MLFAIIGFLFYQVIGWTMWFLQDHVWLRTGQCTDSICSCFNSTLFFILLIFSCIRHHPRLPTHLIFSIHFSALLEICGSVKHGVERVAVCMYVCVWGGWGVHFTLPSFQKRVLFIQHKHKDVHESWVMILFKRRENREKTLLADVLRNQPSLL